MYRQDYGGADPSAGSTLARLGLPAEPTCLLPYLGQNRAVFLCADEYVPPVVPDWPVDRSGLRVSYMWCLGAPEGAPDGVPSFARQAALRGDDTPMIIDPFHQGTTYGPGSSRPWLRKIIVLRLDGRVDDRVRDDAQVGASWRE